jgi:predicted RNA-binding Zn ribbon-like protein
MQQFAIVGGHPALDLANTVAPRRPDGLDHLKTPADLLEWAQRAGVLDASEATRVSAAWSPDATLADVHAIRELIEPALAGRSLPAVSRRWAQAVARSVLVAGDGHAELEIGTDPAFLIGDRLADALVDLLRSADRSRLRECPIPDGGCGWLFLDRSRNGSRRWCTMDDCGTHAKSRRLTERRRARR